MEGQIHSDITILGAGPAGITAALQLGKDGISCLLIDAAQFPKDKVCGDGLSGKVLKTLGMIEPEYPVDLGRQPFVTPSLAVRFVSPKLHMAEIPFHSDNPALPPGFVCKRRDFDHYILQKALKWSSVNFMPNTVIEKIDKIADSFILTDRTGKIQIRTRLLLLATGSHRTAIRSGFPDYPPVSGEGIGVRAYFENVKGSDQNHAIEIHFLKELLPWYFWIFPFNDGSANVGLALPMNLARKNPLSLKELLTSTLEKYSTLQERFAGSKISGKIEAHRLPYFTGRQSISGDQFMLLGDAACLIDPFTGEGISHAMISGYLAAKNARICLEEGDFSARSTLKYEADVYKKLGPELELGMRLQQLASRPRLLNLVIGKASKSEKVRNMLEEMLQSMNTKGKLSQPMFYIKLALGIN
jgi:geranylgeranyl reductase family protein